jgi:hypothetical protein
MEPLRRNRVVMKLDTRRINILLGQIWAIYTAMNANHAQFPSPVVALATFLSLYQAAVVAQQLVQTKAPGAVAARGPSIAALLIAAESLRGYVETLCATLTLEQATALAAAAGMKIAGSPARNKPALQANRGSLSGNVVLIANALLLAGKGKGRRLFNWQYSADGGKTWVAVPSTTDADTSISGLTPLTAYLFRVSVGMGKTEGAWSQAVSLIVH